MKLLTNNPKFLSYRNKNVEVDYRAVSYLEILTEARNHIHMNYRMLTHPMYGSVKPNETLYRSVVLQEEEGTDPDSVVLISSAIETFMKFNNDRRTPLWTEAVMDDFQVIDYDLINNALERIIK